MTRHEHIEWCKKRALQYLDEYHDGRNAVNSMLSDLNKHEETKHHMGGKLGAMLLISGNLNNDHTIRNWINGFN